MQTKSNLWAGATIWANLAITFILYAIVYGGINYLFNQAVDSDSFSLWQPIWEGINPALIFCLTVFAIWLGVRSVLKVTPIDPQNIVRISFYSILVPLLLQLVIVLCSVYLYADQLEYKPNILNVALFLASDVFIFASCFYFLRRHQKNENETVSISSKFGLIGVVILLVIAIPLGIIRYQTQVLVQQAYPEFLKPIPNFDEQLKDEQLKQDRDSQRTSDLLSLSAKIELYLDSLVSVSDYVVWNEICTEDKLYRSSGGTRAIDGTGWLPLDFSKVLRSTFQELEVDPLPSQFFYGFKCRPNSKEYELDAKLESQTYNSWYAKNDGGNNPNLHEIGTNLNLIP
ncbi:MAG: hypothetical protein Q8P97_01970 [bacterium]|nr:hypothetical protein [bacterium]